MNTSFDHFGVISLVVHLVQPSNSYVTFLPYKKYVHVYLIMQMENCSYVAAVVTLLLVLSTHIYGRVLTTNQLHRDDNDKNNMEISSHWHDDVLKAGDTKHLDVLHTDSRNLHQSDRLRRRIQIIPPFVPPDRPSLGTFHRRRYRAVSQETGEWNQSGHSRQNQVIRQRRSLRSPIVWAYLGLRRSYGYGSESGRWGRSTSDDAGLLNGSKYTHDKSTKHYTIEADRSTENTSQNEHSNNQYKIRQKRNAKYWSNQKLLKYIAWREMNGYGSEKNRYG